MESKRSDNLCNFYVLPLVGLNRTSFGSNVNFINSYVSHDNKHLVVELKEAKGDFEHHPQYVLDAVVNGIITVVFVLPQEFLPTVIKFREGKYSQFSDKAKELIKKKSGLNYKVPVGGGRVRSARELLALDKDKDLKRLLEEELAVKLSTDAELQDIPGPEEFYQLDLLPITQG